MCMLEEHPPISSQPPAPSRLLTAPQGSIYMYIYIYIYIYICNVYIYIYMYTLSLYIYIYRHTQRDQIPNARNAVPSQSFPLERKHSTTCARKGLGETLRSAERFLLGACAHYNHFALTTFALTRFQGLGFEQTHLKIVGNTSRDHLLTYDSSRLSTETSVIHHPIIIIIMYCYYHHKFIVIMYY